jgi:ABC-type multidrug transport system ATPase subunit
VRAGRDPDAPRRGLPDPLRVLALIAGADLRFPDAGEFVGLSNYKAVLTYPHMTVREKMAFALKLKKAPKEEVDRKVMEAADILAQRAS